MIRNASHPAGFPGSPAGKETTCNAGDHKFIPGSERSPGEGIGYPRDRLPTPVFLGFPGGSGIGYPLQYSLVAQMVKNLPAMQETQVRSLGWEEPLEEEMVTHSSILAWRIPWSEESGGLWSMGSQRVRQD